MDTYFQEDSPLLKRQFSYIARKNSRIDAGSSLLLKEDKSSPTSTDDGINPLPIFY